MNTYLERLSYSAIVIAVMALAMLVRSSLGAQHNGVEPALEFVNEDDQIYLSEGATVGEGADVEFSVWLFLTSWEGNNPGLWRSGNNSNGGEFMIFQGDTGRPWVRWAGSDILQPDSGYSVPLNEWVQVRFVVTSGESVEFYSRGPGEDWELRHSASHGVDTPEFTLFRYGWQAAPNERAVGIHNRVVLWVNDSPLIQWNLNEGLGAMIAGDASGNGYDGEILGPRWVDTTGAPLRTASTLPFAERFGSVRLLDVRADLGSGQTEIGVAAEGERPFTDEEITITSLPSELTGKIALRTANSEAPWVSDRETTPITDIEWTYIDAVPDLDVNGNPLQEANTTLADGSGLFQPVESGPGGGEEWGLRSFGNNGTILQAFGGDSGGPANTPELKTTVSGLEPGRVYPVTAMFWRDPSLWTIRAGLRYGEDEYRNELFDPNHNTVFEASSFEWASADVLTTEDNRELQAAFLGNAVADENGEIDVFIHDVPTNDGGLRTWYDGVAVGSTPFIRSGSYIVFEVDRDTTVYVINHPSSEPPHLTSTFSPAGMTVETTAGTFEVWERAVAARELVYLPGNGGELSDLNYWVVLGEDADEITENPFDRFVESPNDDWSMGSHSWRSTSAPEDGLHTASLSTEVGGFTPEDGFRLTATVRVPRLQEDGENAIGFLLLGEGAGDTLVRAEWLPRASGGGSVLRFVDPSDESVLAEESWTGLVPARVNNDVGLLDGSEEAFETGIQYLSFPSELLLSDDFEDPAASEEAWSTGGTNNLWQAGEPTTGPGAAQTGQNVFAIGLDDSFRATTDAWLRSPVIDLRGELGASVSFWDFHQLDDDIDFHHASVRVLDGNTLDEIEELERTTGTTEDWRFREFMLAGDSADREVIIEFRLVTDDFSEIDGWFIDNVEVSSEIGATITSMPDDIAPEGTLSGIPGAFDGADATEEDFLEFTVVDNSAGDGNDGVIVYVAWDVRASGLEPDWLSQNFRRTDHFVGVSSAAGYHRLWAREYADGEQVVLGGASSAGPGAEGLPFGTDNYFVLLGDARPGLETFYTLETSGEWGGDEGTLSFSLTDANGVSGTVQTTTTDDLMNRNEFGVAVRHPDPSGENAGHAPIWEVFALSMEAFEEGIIEVTDFEEWREQHFDGQLDDPEVSGPEADPGGDGVANLMKYALGLSPWDPVRPADMPRIESGEDHALVLIYRERTDIEDIVYSPQVSEDLVTWMDGDPHVVETFRGPGDAPNTVEVRVRGVVSEEATRGFLRVKVALDD